MIMKIYYLLVGAAFMTQAAEASQCFDFESDTFPSNFTTQGGPRDCGDFVGCISIFISFTQTNLDGTQEQVAFFKSECMDIDNLDCNEHRERYIQMEPERNAKVDNFKCYECNQDLCNDLDPTGDWNTPSPTSPTPPPTPSPTSPTPPPTVGTRDMATAALDRVGSVEATIATLATTDTVDTLATDLDTAKSTIATLTAALAKVQETVDSIDDACIDSSNRRRLSRCLDGK